MTASKVTFVGLGNMGLPMAANLVRAGFQVTGVDTSEPRQALAREAGIPLGTSVKKAASTADVIVTMLPAGATVRAVYDGDDGILRHAAKDALLIDCSTIDVETARSVAADAASIGLGMVDAPVSGGVGGATAGTLTFMVGGSDSAAARAQPILERMGKAIVHAGGPGAGQAAKICNNLMLGIQMISVAEAFALADRLGLERQALFDISSKASGQCWSLTTYCPVPGPVPTSPANADYSPGFTAEMMLKDLRLAQAAAAETGSASPLGATAAALYALFTNAGNASKDFSAIFTMISQQSGRH